jgi:hypothetical protein
MKVRAFVLVLQCVVGLSVATEAAAVPQTGPKVSQRVTDPGTGLDVRVQVGGGADVSIEIGDASVSVQKQLIHGTDVTTMSTPTERMTVTLAPGRLIVDGTLGRVEASTKQPGSLLAARDLLRRSKAVDKSIALLDRVNLGPLSPLGHTLLSTKALLLIETGSTRGVDELRRWAQNARRAMTLRPVALGQSPTECWNAYAKEAIAAFIEYEDCMRGLKWYEVLDALACAAVYDMRAIGAMSWWLNCVSLI